MMRDDAGATRANDPSAALATEYSEKADAYQQHWSPVIGPMAMPLLDRLPLVAAKWIVDVGAGTGAHLDQLAARAPAARILGVDRAIGMLRAARRRTQHSLAVVDAQSLAIQAATIDIATLIFMLFHLPDPVAGLREVRRILRPGGVIGIVTWGRDDDTPGLAIMKDELDAAGAAPDPRNPVVMQRERLNTIDKLSALLVDGGFTRVHAWAHVVDYRWTTDAIVNVQLGCGVTARRIGNLSQAAATACVERVRRRLAALDADALLYRPEILFATASPST